MLSLKTLKAEATQSCVELRESFPKEILEDTCIRVTERTLARLINPGDFYGTTLYSYDVHLTDCWNNALRVYLYVKEPVYMRKEFFPKEKFGELIYVEPGTPFFTNGILLAGSNEGGDCKTGALIHLEQGKKLIYCSLREVEENIYICKL